MSNDIRDRPTNKQVKEWQDFSSYNMDSKLNAIFSLLQDIRRHQG